MDDLTSECGDELIQD